MTTLGTAAELLACDPGREYGGSGDELVRVGRGDALSSGAAMLVWREAGAWREEGSWPPLDSCSSKYATTRLGTGAEVVEKEGSPPTRVGLAVFGGIVAGDIVGPPVPSPQSTNPSPHTPWILTASPGSPFHPDSRVIFADFWRVRINIGRNNGSNSRSRVYRKSCVNCCVTPF